MPEQAVETARALIDRLGLSSPPVSDGLIFLLGEQIKVRTYPMPVELPGLLARNTPYSYIWLREEDPPVRRRFTVFHELGHYLLHPGVYFCFAKSQQEQQVEREANRFASEMLMPEEWLRRHVGDYGNRPDVLARMYAVSILAMKVRLQELGL